MVKTPASLLVLADVVMTCDLGARITRFVTWRIPITSLQLEIQTISSTFSTFDTPKCIKLLQGLPPNGLSLSISHRESRLENIQNLIII